jgi:hypothetical protein
MIDQKTVDETVAYYQDQVNEGILKSFKVTPIHDDNALFIELWRVKPHPEFKMHQEILVNLK